jgi:uncharacterized membrane protein YjgN (DUF898 family)
MHGAMKRYQHGNLMYGDQRAGFALGSIRLAAPYLAAFVACLVGMVVYGIILYAVSPKGGAQAGASSRMVAFVIATVLLYLFFLLSGLFVMVRINNMAWSNTRFPGVRIDSAMRLHSWLRLQFVNVVLTLLTLGLYRPFAAVRSWRYRLAHVTIDAPEGFDAAVGLAGRRGVTAAGDGAADFLGVDLSW